MKPIILFVLSTNYSGSHYLGRILGAHSKIASLGELRNLARYSNISAKRGISDYDSNPLFEGLSDTDPPNLFRTLFNRLENTHVIVDLSKRTSWPQQLLKNKEFDLRFIHLIRDPRALARRWRLTYDTPRSKRHVRWHTAKHWLRYAVPIMRASEIEVYAYKWLHANQNIQRFLDQNHLTYHRMTYYELTTHTEATLTQLLDWMGFQFEPIQLEFWRVQTPGTQKIDWNQSTQHALDLRWQRDLDSAEQTRVLETPPMHDYVHSLGLQFENDGLITKSD